MRHCGTAAAVQSPAVKLFPFLSTDRLLAGLVHVFTASGAGAGLLALDAAFERQFATMFLWLGLALVIDGVDGTFARYALVKERMPEIDGDILDLVVDYLTYVVVPAVALWRSDLVPHVLTGPLAIAVAIASALYFADTRMKTDDLWFRGFPAIWNVLVFYLFVFRIEPVIATLSIVIATVLMFAPVRFVHPLRVTQLRMLTLFVTGLFALTAVAAVWQNLQATMPIRIVLAGCGVYFIALPMMRRR